MQKKILHSLILKCVCVNMFIFSLFGSVFSQTSEETDSSQVNISLSISDLKIPRRALERIQVLDFKNTEIKDIVRSLATKYNLNIFIDNAVIQRVTLRLTEITVHDALNFIAKENGLEIILDGNIYKIFMPEIQKPVPEPLIVSYSDDLLTIDLKDESIGKVVRRISEVSNKNIIMNRGLDGKITGYIKNIPFEQGLTALMKSNGFTVRKKENIYIIERDYFTQRDTDKKSDRTFWIDVKDSLVTLDVAEADLSRIVLEMAGQLGIDIFVLSDISGKVNAQCTGVPFESVLDYLFKGTNYTYRREGNIYLIGDKTVSGIVSTQLIQMNHIKAEGIIDILPPAVKTRATLQVIKEHNALMVVGTKDVIREVEGFIKKIDYPIPQILIEAIVVDFTASDAGEFGFTAWIKTPGDTSTYSDSFFPNIDITASSESLNKSFQFYGPKLGIKKIGKLPEGFMLNLRALESEGKANIRSQPQIATLNGHPASIKIGTTQYYKLLSERPIVGGNQAFNQISQRFEKITAEISLTITPWVSASGEITTEIKPEFSTPRAFDPEIPPTIDHRILDSTVRLCDGETIVLGGLIQTDDSESIYKFPILGDIPLLGRLFQNRSHKWAKSKLMIYITPHLTYSDKETVYYKGIIK